MVWRILTMGDRAQIAAGIRAGLTNSQIAELVGRDRTVIWRERRRNTTRTVGCRRVSADVAPQRRRARPQVRVIGRDPMLGARVKADLFRLRTPRQIARPVAPEAAGASVGRMQVPLPRKDVPSRMRRFAGGYVPIPLSLDPPIGFDVLSVP